jgi:hypothetical protein
MALIPSYLRRPAAILRIPEAMARGLTVEGFIRELKSAGASYRRTLMLSDWRSVLGIEAKKDLFKYVRKDRIPTMGVVADVEWELSSEYMYKCKTWSRLRPDEPLTERFVNIMSDKPLTPAEIEQQVYSRWGEWERYSAEELKEVRVWAAFHKIEPIEFAEQ